MANYGFRAQIFQRSLGQSVIDKAAYRSGSRLFDERLQLTSNYERKSGVLHTEILAPSNAPAWVLDREVLWNSVERAEKRCDARLAREIQFDLPNELSRPAQLALTREFLQREFVAKGMIADFALHEEKPHHPHIHCMLSTRDIGPTGWGNKRRDWDRRTQLLQWRAAWAHAANRALANEGHEARIDHRSYAARGIELEPQKKRYRIDTGRTVRTRERAQTQEAEIAALRQRNGDRIIARPALVPELLASSRATFSERDIRRIVEQQTHSTHQFEVAHAAVLRCPELVLLGEDAEGTKRYTTRQNQRREKDLLRDAHLLGQRSAHRVAPDLIEQAVATVAREHRRTLNEGQIHAVHHVSGGSDLSFVQGIAGSGKSTMLDAARLAWEAQGYVPLGGALAASAAEGLEQGSHIPSRTLHAWLYRWRANKERLTARHVFVIDEAGMVGTELFAQVASEVRRAGAKLVVVGDTAQLKPIDPGAPMRVLVERYGASTLTEVIRQELGWQKQLTLAFARNDAAHALQTYADKGRVHAARDAQQACHVMVERWDAARRAAPGETSLLLGLRRKDVATLNELARDKRKRAGELGPDHLLDTERGRRSFAVGDRIYFLRNDAALGVHNGSLGTVEHIDAQKQLFVRLDNHQQVVVDACAYRALDHGYAATIHKSQGVTVDRAYVLASRYMDASATYVAMSRHRKDAQLYYSEEDFRTPKQLITRLARNKLELTAHEVTALAAERLTKRFAQEDNFLALPDSARQAALATLHELSIQNRLNPGSAFERLPQILAAEREVRDARRQLELASQLAAEFERAHPVQAKLHSAAYREHAEAAVDAQRQLKAATQRLSVVRKDPKLLAMGDRFARLHNRRINDAAKRIDQLQQALKDHESDSFLARLARHQEQQGRGHRYRAATRLDEGRGLPIVSQQQLNGIHVLVLDDGQARPRVLAATSRCVLEREGASVRARVVGRAAPQLTRAFEHVRGPRDLSRGR